MSQIHVIPVSPEVIGNISGVSVTTAHVSAIAVVLLVIGFIFLVRSRVSIVPGRLQVAAETILMLFHDRLVDAYGGNVKRARKYLPLIVGLFLFIFFSNYFTLIPLVQSITYEGEGLFRPPTSHLGLTVTLALIVFLISNVIAFSMSPKLYLGNFIKFGELLKVRSFGNLAKAMLDIFLGLLDIVGELAKVISLSCRLFGNVFAGEVMVSVIAGLSAYTQFLFPAPFYGLGLLSGLIQALVFSVLSLSFISGMHNNIRGAKEAALAEKQST